MVQERRLWVTVQHVMIAVVPQDNHVIVIFECEPISVIINVGFPDAFVALHLVRIELWVSWILNQEPNTLGNRFLHRSRLL